jgi:hypothetical protein
LKHFPAEFHDPCKMATLRAKGNIPHTFQVLSSTT